MAGCGSGGGADGYGPELRADFVQACAPGADEASCGCFYDRLAAEVPYERFEELDAQLVDDPTSLPDDIVDLAVACSAPEVADADASG